MLPHLEPSSALFAQGPSRRRVDPAAGIVLFQVMQRISSTAEQRWFGIVLNGASYMIT
jgi:hypothetical protein